LWDFPHTMRKFSHSGGPDAVSPSIAHRRVVREITHRSRNYSPLLNGAAPGREWGSTPPAARQLPLGNSLYPIGNITTS
jgi:hypothetical protein